MDIFSIYYKSVVMDIIINQYVGFENYIATVPVSIFRNGTFRGNNNYIILNLYY